MGAKIMKVNVENGKISYSCNNNCNEKQIVYTVLDKQGQADKRFQLDMNGDFNFHLYKYAIHNVKDFEKIREFDLQIEKDNPMYKSFENFLHNKKSFILDDDKTEDINKKTMSVINNDDNIKIVFKNENENDINIQNRFSVFIKNVKYDEDSKLDKDGIGSNNTKAKLAILFDELGKSIEDYRQIKINEKQQKER